jgi:putative intracellular protease/amidase
MAKVLIPLPSRDFDPTEAAVSWEVLTRAGHEVSFATPDARPAEGDPLMLTGEGLDPWGRVPGLSKLKLAGLILRADARGRAAYARMAAARAYRAPLAWEDIDIAAFDGLLLPGGHRARGMRSYLESPALQDHVVKAFRRAMPVAAICHGVVLAARGVDPATGRSVLYGHATTALTWSLENSAARLARITRFWDPTYYRTYVEAPGEPPGFRGVEAEVTRALATPGDFRDVDPADPDSFRKTSGLFRDTATDARPAFVVCDRNYVSARWPGDAHTFARTFATLLD